MGSAELYLVAGLLLAAFAVYSAMSMFLSQSADAKALSWASGDEPVRSKSGLVNSSRPLVHQFTLKYALKIKNERYRNRVERMILTAGLSRELNVDEFIGLQLLWGVMFPVVLMLMNFSLEMGLPVFLIVLMIPLGAYFPILYANREKREREMSVRADLPFFADLLSLSTEAGLDFISAIQRIVQKAEASVLAEELAQVLQDIKLGASRAEALKKMAHRLETSEVTSFVAVVIDADATGAPISQVLKDQSTQIRLERFVRAEKLGARASQTMLIPMMIFIMPAVFLAVFGPLVVQFFYNGKS